MSSQVSPIGGKHVPVTIVSPFTVNGIETPKLEQSRVHKEEFVGVVGEGLEVNGFPVGSIVKGLLVGRGVVMGAEVETAAGRSTGK